MGRRSPTTASVRSRRIALRLRSRAVPLALFYWLHRVSCVSSAKRFPKVPPISNHGIYHNVEMCEYVSLECFTLRPNRSSTGPSPASRPHYMAQPRAAAPRRVRIDADLVQHNFAAPPGRAPPRPLTRRAARGGRGSRRAPSTPAPAAAARRVASRRQGRREGGGRAVAGRAAARASSMMP